MEDLTPKQELFCLEYLIDFNAKKAAARAGYSASGAAVAGSRNLSHPGIRVRLQELIENRKARVLASADYVLQRLIDIDKLDLADIVDDEGNLLPISQWTEAWRLSVTSIDISETKTANALIKKIRMPDKLKNLELIGKHVNVLAFRDRADGKADHQKPLVVNVSTPQAKEDMNTLMDMLKE